MKVSKREIRQKMRRERAAMAADDKRSRDLTVKNNFIGSGLLPQAGCVYCYYSMEEEIDTTELMESLLYSCKKVACPRVEDGRISFYYIQALTDCCPGFRGICEPLPGCERAADENALVVVPGLAFSREGERIGYGGGYYDRFLAAEPSHETVALAYTFQVMDTLPCDERDLKVSWIITDGEVIKTDFIAF